MSNQKEPIRIDCPDSETEAFCEVSGHSPVFEALVSAPVNGPFDWILPKAAIELFESMGYVTIKDGKKWAFGGWLHEDKRA